MKSAIVSGLAVAAVALLIALGGSGITRAQEDGSNSEPAVAQCKALLPENRQYTMNIDLYIDTSAGAQSTLDIILLDDAIPESTAIPEGTEGFVNCVLRTLGLPDEQI
jgi:hypothetical protein